jgi:hypothetical protein
MLQFFGRYRIGHKLLSKFSEPAYCLRFILVTQCGYAGLLDYITAMRGYEFRTGHGDRTWTNFIFPSSGLGHRNL